MASDQAAVGLAFGAYFLVLAVIGWAAWRRTRGIADYLLGGRRLGRWVAALSAGASDMSGWLLLGLPGLAYASGVSSLWLVGGLLAGTWLNWRLVAARLREATARTGDALTLPEYLARRFPGGGALRVTAALLILGFYLLYTASGLVAGGRLFETVFGLPYPLAVTAGALAIVAYTMVGGFLAVSWTDLFQALLMALALVWVPLAAVAALGGPAATIESLAATPLTDPLATADGPLGVIGALSLAGWGLGYFGQPHILARFMAIRSTDEVGPARRIAVTWTAIGLVGAVAVGLTGAALLPGALPGAEREQVFMHLVSMLMHPVPAGVCLAAILAAIMSTADSQMLVASSALTEDLYRPWRAGRAGERELVWAGRVTVLLVALAAWGLALTPGQRVLDLVGWAWAGFGATFGPVLLLALTWPGMRRSGALAALLTGAVVVVAWRQASGGWFELYELVPAFAASLAAGVTASLVAARRAVG